MTLTLSLMYELLLRHFGSQNWWPVDIEYHSKDGSDSRFEIMIGAILTQNTSWGNVEKAIINLKQENSLKVQKILEMDVEKLKKLIRPSGFFNQKAQRLKTLASYLRRKYSGDLDRFFKKEMEELREELLSLNGIGPETADSILLYAGGYPVFVIDAYTKRVCKRIPLPVKNLRYGEIQRYFEDEISRNTNEIVEVYKELHALIVKLAKSYCRKKPECTRCPLKNHCEYPGVYLKRSSSLSANTDAGISGSEIS
jgi:endonuclease-3 related protein